MSVSVLFTTFDLLKRSSIFMMPQFCAMRRRKSNGILHGDLVAAILKQSALSH
jgi:hypothetical protein